MSRYLPALMSINPYPPSSLPSSCSILVFVALEFCLLPACYFLPDCVWPIASIWIQQLQHWVSCSELQTGVGLLGLLGGIWTPSGVSSFQVEKLSITPFFSSGYMWSVSHFTSQHHQDEAVRQGHFRTNRHTHTHTSDMCVSALCCINLNLSCPDWQL